MQTFWIGVAGVIVGLVLTLGVGVLGLRRRLRAGGRARVTALGAAGVPPFRVSLAPAPAPAWADSVEMERILQGFTAAGYSHCGDFEIPELGGLGLRSFFHRELGSFGILYDHPEVGLFVDLVREHGDGTTTTVTSGPESGMDRPEYTPSVRLAVDVTGLDGVARLHERLEEESAGREGMPTTPADFPAVFVEAYTQEMDWRIARGGLTAQEIRRAARAAGQAEPDARAVRQVQARWRRAIAVFVEEEVRRSWLADSGLGAAEWEELRERIEVVHEYGAAGDRVESLARQKVEGDFPADDDRAEQQALQRARDELAPLFAAGVRAGFAEAQRLLPEKRRHRLLASVDAPWPADVYCAPRETGAG